MNDLDPKEPDEFCNARRTDGSGYCGQPAGWGTDHETGRCKFHGGNTPQHEKHVIKELEAAAEDAGVALRLKLKHIRQRLEDGEDVDWKELDRLSRTVLDRTDVGPSETREYTGEIEGSDTEIVVEFGDKE